MKNLTNAPTIFITTNGCQRRDLDGSRLIKFFELNDCTVVKKPDNADYIVFITCSFKKDKEEQSLKLIDRFNEYEGELIVAGCLPTVEPDKFKQRFKGRFITTTTLQEIDTFFSDFKIKFSDVPDANFTESKYKPHILSRNLLKKISKQLKLKIRNLIKPVIEKKHLKPALLRISHGCVGNCAYCGARRARGSLISKPLDALLREYQGLLDKGFRRFIIIADDVGSYGLDINSSFSELLKNFSLLDEGLEVKWSIQDLHPIWVAKYEAELLKRIKEKKITDILCPIQSGSERILGLMNRHHNLEEISKCFSKFRKANSNFRIFTQVIIGLPSETEKDFLATLSLIEKIRFDRVQVFAYYDGGNTPASRMDNKVSEKVIEERVERTIKFLDKIRIVHKRKLNPWN